MSKMMMGKQKIIPGDTTEAKWPRPEKVESMLSTVQGNSVICLVQVNNFPPFALEVKYGLVSFLYHEDTSVIHLTLHSLSCSFFFASISLSYLSSTLCAHFKFLIHLSESKARIAAIPFSLIYLHSV